MVQRAFGAVVIYPVGASQEIAYIFTVVTFVRHRCETMWDDDLPLFIS